jgi:hypothetical protein
LNQEIDEALFLVMAEVDFAARYYAFCDAARGVATGRRTTGKDRLAAILAEVAPGLAWQAVAGALTHEERHGNLVIGVDVSVGNGVEMGLSLETPGGRTGFPYAVLAEEVALLRDPDFAHDPPYPQLPFADEAQLIEAVRFGLALFADARRAILAHDGRS